KLYYLRDGAFRQWRTTDGIVAHTIHALLVDRAGDLWIGGNAPESLQRLHAGQIENLNLPPKISVIRALAEDAAGNIWLGAAKGSLLRVNGTRVVDETALMKQPYSIRTLYTTAD